ncbi:serine hydrolase [Lacticigenium naphthae]|uniref:serine hydrolase n=1 Tax=Lacticigenium naphthae TaxID=515351 RepID=UPI0003FB2FD6|nr:serine hydrolase [Lacticigenium naphthae]
MKKIKKIVLSSLVTSLIAPVTGFSAQSVLAKGPEVDAKAGFLVDVESKKVLYNENGDTELGIASMTKMIVEYLLFEAIENGEVTWDQEVEISEYVHEVSQDYLLSNVPLRIDETYTIQELYEALAIYSANGATIAIAEAIAGDEVAFVDRMREKVESWGITDYQLVNTTGLNNQNLFGKHYPGSAEDDENSMSARDIAKIAIHLLEDYPEVLETSSISEKVFREGTSDSILMKNWNWMLPGLLFEKENVDGLKTGTTEYAGASITATMTEGNTRIVSVIMGAGDGQTNKGQRFEETTKLLDYGMAEWKPLPAVESEGNIEAIEPVTISKGKEKTVEVVPNEALAILVPENISEEDLIYSFEPNEKLLDNEGALEAPIEKGTEVGNITVSYEGDSLGYLGEVESATVPAVTAGTVEKANIFALAIHSIKNFFGNLMERF